MHNYLFEIQMLELKWTTFAQLMSIHLGVSLYRYSIQIHIGKNWDECKK